MPLSSTLRHARGEYKKDEKFHIALSQLNETIDDVNSAQKELTDKQRFHLLERMKILNKAILNIK